MSPFSYNFKVKATRAIGEIPSEIIFFPFSSLKGNNSSIYVFLNIDNISNFFSKFTNPVGISMIILISYPK